MAQDLEGEGMRQLREEDGGRCDGAATWAGDQPTSSISLEAEVPAVLFEGMRDYIRSHPQWDQYRLVTAALAHFLFQHGSEDACVSQHYLNGLFMR